MELNRLLPFNLSSFDFLEKPDDGTDVVWLLDDVPRNNENAGGRGRGCGVEMGGAGDSGRYCVSGETIMSSTSNSSSSSSTLLALSVSIEGCGEDSSSPSSAE